MKRERKASGKIVVSTPEEISAMRIPGDCAVHSLSVRDSGAAGRSAVAWLIGSGRAPMGPSSA